MYDNQHYYLFCLFFNLHMQFIFTSVAYYYKMFIGDFMVKKEDLRIRKTKANLYRALLQLMEEKTFEDIKVIDICNVSMINRSTFYDHFNDKYELLASFIEDLKNELIEHLDVQIEANSIKEYYIELLKLLLDYFSKNINMYSSIAIVKKNNNSIAFDMMFDASLEAVTKRLKEHYINTFFAK